MVNKLVIKENEEICASQSSDEILSVEECKKCFGQYMLTDENVEAIKNNLVGLVDSIINSYIESVSDNEQR